MKPSFPRRYRSKVDEMINTGVMIPWIGREGAWIVVPKPLAHSYSRASAWETSGQTEEDVGLSWSVTENGCVIPGVGDGVFLSCIPSSSCY